MKGEEGCSDDAIAFGMKDSHIASMAGDGCGERIPISYYGEVRGRGTRCRGGGLFITCEGVGGGCVGVEVIVLCEGENAVFS